jgi:hypothetical protein
VKNLAVIFPVGLLLVAGCASPRSSSLEKPAPSRGNPDAGAQTASACDTSMLSTDAHHCGSCDNDCGKLPGVDPSRVACKAGVCDVTSACAVGRAHCSNKASDGCETDVTTSAHCGSCTTACTAPNSSCTSTSGSYSCNVGCAGSTPTMCNGSCVDTNSNIANCGGCGMACPSVNNGSATCSVGQCGIQCDDGYDQLGDHCVASGTSGSNPDMGSTMMPPASTPVEWTAQTSPVGESLQHMWGTSATNLLIVGYSGSVLTSDGSGTWKVQSKPGSRLVGLWGADASTVKLAGLSSGGSPAIWSSDGTMWDRTLLNYSLNAVWGSGATDWYVAGGSGNLWHSTDFTNWTGMSTNTSADLWGIWGASADKVFVVGNSGRVLRRLTDGTWNRDTANTTSNLYAVWGSSATDVYAVGQKGTILHSDGSGTFTKQSSGFSDDLNAVWGSSATDIYAAGASGLIVHSQGDGNWALSETGIYNVALWGMWGTSATDVYAVGDSGTILHKK